MENKELMFFEPVFKTMIWGGKKMGEVFGYDIPGDNTGECWAISAHPNGDCRVKGGPLDGRRLSELWENERELFGDYPGDRFPLLLKVIDAKENLSIQVHPSDDYARIHENGSLGKTECWYILDCDEDSTIVVGHNAKSEDELCKLIDEHRFTELIREVPIKKGDFIQIEPGTVHAIKGGVMILETQQNSDITYRVYDYDRLSNGKPRELHIEQSKAVIKVPADAGAVLQTGNAEGLTHLVSCKYYSVSKLVVRGAYSLDEEGCFRLVSVIDGEGTANNIPVKAGNHFIAPCGLGPVKFEGNMTIITSIPA